MLGYVRRDLRVHRWRGELGRQGERRHGEAEMTARLQDDLRDEHKMADARKDPGYRAMLDALAKLKPGEELEYYRMPTHEVVVSLWPSGAFAAVRDAQEKGSVLSFHRRSEDGRLLYMARRK
jgi:hypothetical protein